MVYDLNIRDLAIQDERWNVVWNEFLLSCTTPQYLDLPDHDQHELRRTTFGTPRIFESKVERYKKIKGHFKKLLMDDVEKRDWYPNGGKFSRDPISQQNIITASRVLGNILGDQLLGNSNSRGNFYYPNGGYREWHTNQYDLLGWRLYMVHTSSNQSAYFKYIDPATKEVKTCIDEDGCFRLFKIESGSNALWHSVISEGDRWSLGYWLCEETAQKLIQLHSQMYVTCERKLSL